MKKTVCFFVCFVITFLSCFSSYAKETEISLSSRKSSSNIFYVDVFVVSDEKLSGGEFVISFDGNNALYNDVSSEIFEIDAFCKDSQVKIVIAEKDPVSVGENEAVFSVKFKRNKNSTADIKLQTITLCDEALDTFVPENELIDATVDMKNGTITEVKNKDKSKKDVSENDETKKESVTEADSTKSQATSDFVPVKIDADSNNFLVILAVLGLVIVAFILGVVFSKTFEKKKNKNDKKVD